MTLNEITKVKNKDYYTADTIWKMLGTPTREDYVQKYIIPGRFHSLVPEDVINAYLTAEYLMAHAWYYWPMYDEALKKLTHIFEIAVKQKAKQLNIPLNTNRDKKLANIINKICVVEKEKKLHESLNKLRMLRNMFAHPDRNSFMGALGGSPDVIRIFITTINLLFLDNSLFKGIEKLKEKMTELARKISEGLYILNYRDMRYLVHEVIRHEVYPADKKPRLFLVLNPVLRDAHGYYARKNPPDVITLALEITETDSTFLRGRALADSSKIVLEPTFNPQDMESYNTFLADMRKVRDEGLDTFGIVTRQRAAMRIERLKYEFLINP